MKNKNISSFIRKIILEQIFDVDYSNESFIPSDKMVFNARAALNVLSTKKQGITADKNEGSGSRKAEGIVSKKPHTHAQAKRMLSFFETNRQNVINEKSRGKNINTSDIILSWELHGGDAGMEWAKKCISSSKDDAMRTKKVGRSLGGDKKTKGMGMFDKNMMNPINHRIHDLMESKEIVNEINHGEYGVLKDLANDILKKYAANSAIGIKRQFDDLDVKGPTHLEMRFGVDPTKRILDLFPYYFRIGEMESKDYGPLNGFIKDALLLYICFRFEEKPEAHANYTWGNRTEGKDFFRGSSINLFYDKNKEQTLREYFAEKTHYTDPQPVNFESQLYMWMHFLHSSSLLHELQHAYDDWRSKGKFMEKNHLEFSKKYKDIKQPTAYFNGDEDTDDYKERVKKFEEKNKTYLRLPHEVWARFIQALQKIALSSADIRKNKKGETAMVYDQKDFKRVFSDFKMHYHGWQVLDQDMKRRLIKALMNIWNEENQVIKIKNLKSDF